jgi:hypothetical protein
MFHTTVKEILRFNPDITNGGTNLQVGQTKKGAKD